MYFQAVVFRNCKVNILILSYVVETSIRVTDALAWERSALAGCAYCCPSEDAIQSSKKPLYLEWLMSVILE